MFDWDKIFDAFRKIIALFTTWLNDVGQYLDENFKKEEAASE